LSNLNKKLAQLEAIYDINNHHRINVDGSVIESYINNIFENASQHGIDGLTKDWFDAFKKKNPVKASNFVYNILKESGTLISKQSIFESIRMDGV